MLLRASILSGPLLLFAYTTIGVKLLSASEALQLISSLAASHLLGSLPGIAIGITQSTTTVTLTKKTILASFTLPAIITIILIIAKPDSWHHILLAATSFASTYFDILSKKHNPRATIKCRITQAVATPITLAIIVFQHTPITAEAFILGRSVINALPLLFLGILVPTENRAEKAPSAKKSFDIKTTTAAFVWMAGSNSIFLLPSITADTTGTTNKNYIITAYLIQVSLQLCGRLSDYLTLKELHSNKTSRTELVIISLLVFIFLSGTTIVADSIKFEYWSLLANMTLSLAILLWSYGDSKYSVKLFQNIGSPNNGAIAGISASAITFSILAIEHLTPQNTSVITALIAPLVGSASYAFFAKAKG